MLTFLSLYRGRTVAEAKMVAVTADPELVALVASHLLAVPQEQEEDRVVAHLERGRRAALRLIKREATAVPAETVHV
jgi:hypothetical protein